jgi:hypothetical protein
VASKQKTGTTQKIGECRLVHLPRGHLEISVAHRA